MAKQAQISPLRILAWILSSIGKPIYFLLSHIVLTLIFVFYILGHTIHLLFVKVSKKKIRFPKIRFPSIKNVFKLEGLRISLFELRIISRAKKLFIRKITRFQKLQLKIRIRFFIVFIHILLFLEIYLPQNNLEQESPKSLLKFMTETEIFFTKFTKIKIEPSFLCLKFPYMSVLQLLPRRMQNFTTTRASR
jgi:hypothetical protein